MKPIVLRPDQENLKGGIYQEFNQGAIDVCGQLATGGGKSVVSSDITLDYDRAGHVSCVMAHRVELTSQMSMHVADRGIAHRLIAPKPIVAQVAKAHREKYNRVFLNPDARCSVGSVDTILARSSELTKLFQQCALIQTDEAHHQLVKNKWGAARLMFERARGLGWTATPSRSDGQGLGRRADGFFDAMVRGPEMRWLIDNGCLTDYQIVCPKSDFQISDNDLAPSGDWSTTKMQAASDKSQIVGDVVTSYVKYAYGKRAICFATDVKTAGKIADRYNAIGIPAAAVSAKSDAGYRDEMIKRFKAGTIWVLINVDLFGEGFDVPACEVVIMARPTASLGLYLQMFGRALRLMAGKAWGLIIDHVSNVLRHGLPDKRHPWSLDRREKRAKSEPDPEEIKLTVCRECSKPYERFHASCPYCGFLPVPVGGGRTIEEVDGDLILLDREALEKLRAATILPTPADVGNRAGFAAGPMAAAGAINRSIERHAAQQELSDAIAQWAGVQRWKGRDDQQSYRRFYLATGVDVLTALTQPRADMERLAQTVKGWL